MKILWFLRKDIFSFGIILTERSLSLLSGSFGRCDTFHDVSPLLPIRGYPVALIDRTFQGRLDLVSPMRGWTSAGSSAFHSSLNDKSFYRLIATPRNISEKCKNARLYYWEQTLLVTEFLMYRDVHAAFGLWNPKHFPFQHHISCLIFLPVWYEWKCGNVPPAK